MTITEFLLARIEADEAEAHAALAEDPAPGRGGQPWFGGDGPEGYAWVILTPERALAECEAKRRIVERHPIYRGPRILDVGIGSFDYGCEKCHCIDPIHEDGIIEAAGECETLLALASTYADHPDFQEEWGTAG